MTQLPFAYIGSSRVEMSASGVSHDWIVSETFLQKPTEAFNIEIVGRLRMG